MMKPFVCLLPVMMKLLRHGGRTVCVVVLLANLPLGFCATRAARVAQKPPIEFAAAEPDDSTDVAASGQSSLAIASDDEAETSSRVAQVVAEEIDAKTPTDFDSITSPVGQAVPDDYR